MGVFSYYVIKYPKLCKSIYEEKTTLFQSMTHFNNALLDKEKIYWYAEDLEEGVMDNIWLKCHVSRSLKHLKQKEDFEMKSIQELESGSVLLTPKKTDVKEIEKAYPNLEFVIQDESVNLSNLSLYFVE